MYWQGEGCICEIEIGVRCKGMSKDFIPQCNCTDDDLEEMEGEDDGERIKT